MTGRSAHVALRRFPVVVAAEVVLVLLVVFIAPFLHGSARNQAYQAYLARNATGPLGKLPKLPPKEAVASTWTLGVLETLAVIAVMVAGYWLSGRLARRRRVTGSVRPEPGV